MIEGKRKCMKQVNKNLFSIINIIFDEKNEVSTELRKLLFYQNTTSSSIVSPLEKDNVPYKSLFLKNVFPYRHIPDIQDEVMTYMNIYYDAFYVEKSDPSRREERGYLVVDILTHKEMEMILIDKQFAVRKYEIMSRVRELLDNNRKLRFLGGLGLYHWGEFDSPSAKHNGLRLTFYINEIT